MEYRFWQHMVYRGRRTLSLR